MLKGLISFFRLLLIGYWVVIVAFNVYLKFLLFLHLVVRQDQSFLVGCFEVDRVIDKLVLKTNCSNHFATQHWELNVLLGLVVLLQLKNVQVNNFEHFSSN